ncbi:unnamed protein product [Acanthoscelides obtectus]|uniref:Uncharacterized protein n=1 Tax=Acanthoscelides obtectus TaxID=200917 RepID=A0A9P0MFL3_ACAOB|nr:unnamed protein product [Acanthoscelides obtectus]CAK1662639.1 Synaptotagmin-15 [Acanthoscelides obtectus]
MDKDHWKRELFVAKSREYSNHDWDLLKQIHSTSSPLKGFAPTEEAHAERVLAGKVRDGQTTNHVFSPFSLAAIAACGLLLLTVVLAYAFIRRNRRKHLKDDYNTSSILVYPSSRTGSPPQFQTKDIHFSLPPLRSTSLGDLAEDPYDSDVGITDALLLPTVGCYGLGVIEPALYKSTLDLDEIQWPEGHIGRLWFSLKYEPSTEKLLVSLLKAKNLPSRTVGTVNSCDPFVSAVSGS